MNENREFQNLIKKMMKVMVDMDFLMIMNLEIKIHKNNHKMIKMVKIKIQEKNMILNKIKNFLKF